MAERITFDSSLYSPEAVEATATAYADYAKIAINSTDGATEAVIEDGGEYEMAELVNAFSNHALHETIVRRRQSALEAS